MSKARTVSLSKGTGRPRLSLATLSLVLFLTFLDNTIVSVTLSNVQSTLHTGVSGLQWVVSAYALVFASLMLPAGTVSDLLGRKKVMLAGVGVFCAGSVLGALAPNIDVLWAARAIMGLGAAASEPGTLSMIRHLYTDRRDRAQALGVWAAVSGLALAAGPVIGGALVGVWNWRAVFWFNLFFGIVAFVGAALVLPENSDPQVGRHFDFRGFILGVGALASATFATIAGETAGYRAWWIVTLFAIAGVARQLPEIRAIETYAGTPAPFNFNGLVRRRGLLPPAGIRRVDVRRVCDLLRRVLDLLLRSPLPRSSRRRVGVQDRARLPPDGWVDGDRKRVHRSLGSRDGAPDPDDVRVHPRHCRNRSHGGLPDTAERSQPPRLDAPTGGDRVRSGSRARDLDGSRRDPARTLGHGGLCDEYEPRARRGRRCGDTRVGRERSADRSARQAADAPLSR